MIRNCLSFCFSVLVSVLCLGKLSLAYPAGNLGGGGVIPAVTSTSETDYITIDSITPLKIGDKIPEELWEMHFPVVSPHSDNVQYLSLGDFRDKLIILDFWATWCAPCISSLHKLDTLQKEFADDLLVFPTSYETQGKVSKFFIDKGWTLPTAFDETQLKKYFPHRSIPHQVWLKDGEVMAITGSGYTDRENISNVLRDKDVDMYEKEEINKVDLSKPLLLDGNGAFGAADLFSYSLFTGYLDGAPHNGGYMDDSSLVLTNRTLPSLYSFAFLDKIPYEEFHYRVLYEVPDLIKNRLVPPAELSSTDRMIWFKDNAYSCNLVMPEDTADSVIYRYLLSDLDRFLNGLMGVSVSVEKRKVKCMALVKADRRNAPEKSTNSFSYDVANSGVTYTNTSLDYFLKGVRSVNRNCALPIIDATGIDYNIDITIDGGRQIGSDSFDDQLKKNGLAFQEGYYEIEMIVFSSSSPSLAATILNSKK